MDNLSGRVIRGYELRETIGEGGFGAVYRAFQPAVGREVAIKIILPQYANHPEFIRRFEKEAQIVARLEHLHIVPLFDYWRDPEGAYLIMRMLKGGSLREAIHNAPYDPDNAARVLGQIASALAVAHRNGVIHRDLKPGNILLDEEGNAYLADFGIAKVDEPGSDDDENPETITGSPAYISPEQILSQPVTAQTDIYALGVVLFEMLTGRQPFHDMTAPELVFKHLHDPLPYLQDARAGLPDDINDVIQRATAKKPEDRYGDVMAMAADFRRTISGEIAPVLESLIDWESIPNPYKGLRAFEEADADDFYGREALVEHLVDRLGENHPMVRFLAVVGPSGSGKSSVVKAGVIPALRRGALATSANWFIAEMTPGTHPLQELESALLSVAVKPATNLIKRLESSKDGLMRVVEAILPENEELLLVIDQFEEVFTLLDDEEQRTHLLNSLLFAVTNPGSRLRVIVTLRADFYDKPLLYEGFAGVMRQRTEVVVPLTSEELERAIVSPAERAGLEVEPELLATIINDLSEEPGTLPLLQYALTEVFERRTSHILTQAAYQASGGALGALARRAEEIFETMEPERQLLIRQLFLRLVTLGEGTEDTRRRLGWDELTSFTVDGPDVQAILGSYSKFRLLTLDRDPKTRAPTIEIAHEALIREWQRLRDWLSSGRESVRMQRRLAAGAEEWRVSNRDASFLLRGGLLQQMEDWATTTDIALTDEERGYLAASIVERRAQEAREEARRKREQEQERRRRTRLLVAVAVLAVVAGISLGFTVFAFIQRADAENRAATAVAAQGTAASEAVIFGTQAAEANTIAATAVIAEREAFELADNEAARASNLERQIRRTRSLLLVAHARNSLLNDDPDIALSLAIEAVSMPDAAPEARDFLEEITEIDADEAQGLTIAELIQWTRDNFDVRELTCDERETYQVLPLCSE